MKKILFCALFSTTLLGAQAQSDSQGTSKQKKTQQHTSGYKAKTGRTADTMNRAGQTMQDSTRWRNSNGNAGGDASSGNWGNGAGNNSGSGTTTNTTLDTTGTGVTNSGTTGTTRSNSGNTQGIVGNDTTGRGNAGGTDTRGRGNATDSVDGRNTGASGSGSINTRTQHPGKAVKTQKGKQRGNTKKGSGSGNIQ